MEAFKRINEIFMNKKIAIFGAGGFGRELNG
jgi:hypothetical protein